MTARKKAIAPTADTVSIHDACLKYMTTEQGLRLALSHIRPDDFDTVKAISELDLEAIAPYFQPKQPQLPETPQNIETPIHQASEPATEQQQNALSLPQRQQHLTVPTQSSKQSCPTNSN